MATEIVAAQAGLTPLSQEEITESLYKIFQTLKAMQQFGEGAATDAAASKNPQSSIQHEQVVCLECGYTFQLLSNRHLALHGLTPREYKQKHGIRMAQPLSARALSDRRRKLAKERDMGKQLAVWRADRKRRAG
jgi:predicted transcriptional regulator